MKYLNFKHFKTAPLTLKIICDREMLLCSKFWISGIVLLVQVQLLKSGNFLRLRHAQTGCYLHSHVRKAALTPYDQIVSCHKNSLHEAKLNEIWRLDIADVTGASFLSFAFGDYCF